MWIEEDHWIQLPPKAKKESKPSNHPTHIPWPGEPDCTLRCGGGGAQLDPIRSDPIRSDPIRSHVAREGVGGWGGSRMETGYPNPAKALRLPNCLRSARTTHHGILNVFHLQTRRSHGEAVRLRVQWNAHGGDLALFSPPPHSMGGVSLRAPPGGDWTAVG